jgi:hypothetical protein
MICELQAKHGALARQGQTTRTRVRSRPAPTDGQAETKSRCPKSAKARCGPAVGGSHTRTQTRADYKRYAAQGRHGALAERVSGANLPGFDRMVCSSASSYRTSPSGFEFIASNVRSCPAGSPQACSMPLAALDHAGMQHEHAAAPSMWYALAAARIGAAPVEGLEVARSRRCVRGALCGRGTGGW